MSESNNEAPPGGEKPDDGTGPSESAPERTPEAIRHNIRVLARGLGVEPAETDDSKPPLDLAAPLQVLGRELGLLARDSSLFRQGAAFLTVDPRNGETRPMDSTRFCSWIEEFAWPCKWERKERVFSRVGKELAGLVIASDAFRDHVRELRGVHVVRLPTWRGSDDKRTIELLPVGFDEPSGIYTVDTLPFDHEWAIPDAAEWLSAVLKDYPWADERSMAAHVAAMLSPFTRLLLPTGAKRTMIVYNGNQPGTGKSTLARMALFPVYGDAAAKSVDRNPDELRKILETAALERKPFLFLDDMGDLRSRELNSFVTNGRLSARVLGHSRSEEAPIEAQVVITGNQMDIGKDLERRALVVDLFYSADPLERRFTQAISDEWLLLPETRAKFLAFQWAAVRHWRDRGMRRDEESYRPSFEAYSSLVGSIVVEGGYTGPFSAREWKIGGDDEGEAMQALLRAAAKKVGDGETEEFRPADLLAMAEELELLDVITPWAKNPKQVLGHKLKRWRGRQLKDDAGRLFEFGKHESSRGAIYPLQILSSPKTAVVSPRP